MMENNYISIGKAAKMIGVTTTTLRRWDQSGRFRAIRTPSGRRMYAIEQIEGFLRTPIFSQAFNWIGSATPQEPPEREYCQASSVFQLRVMKLEQEFAKIEDLAKVASLIVAAVGEIGNNSFDHNIGNWPDVPGIFFGYDLKKRQIVLADRGQGILRTLKRVRPRLENDEQALEVAFTEVLSGRAPEERGNGLKFVRKIVPLAGIELFFQTGSASVKLTKERNEVVVSHSEKSFRGCLVLIKF